MTVADGGTVSARVVYLGNPGFTSGAKTAVVGTIAIGGAVLANAPGVLDIADDINIGGFGAIVLNHDSSHYAFNTAVESIAYGDGLLDQRAGTTMLTGDLDRYTGRTEVHGGSLFVDTQLGSSVVTVFSGGRLGGRGTVAGGVTVRSGGTLAGGQDNSPLEMTTLNLLDGANVNVGLESQIPLPVFNVRGDLTLDGTLNVNTGTLALGQGLYRLFNYGGTLIDHGLDIGVVPSGNNPESLSIFLGTPGQVNLLSSGGSDDTVNFWGGGSGAISIGGSGWTNAAGDDVPLQAARFLVLAGAPGTLTIDVAAGDIHPLGFQFAADGYAIDGNALDLADTRTTLRVGDGTSAGAAISAAITATLTGAGGIDKTDLGKLTLGAANSFAGGTSISGGTLIGSAGSFGSGDIADNAALVVNADSAAVLANAINGSGTFTKTGVALLALTGTSDLTGETHVHGGRLAVNGSLANSLIVVEDGATLGGSGIVGSVQVLNGGHVDPGNSPGLLTVNGNFMLDPGGILTMQIAGDVAGVSYDVLRVLGDLDLADGFLELVFLDGFTPVIGESFELFDVAGAFQGTKNLLIRGLPGNWQFNSSFDPNSGKFTLTSTGSTTDVPASNPWSLLIVGVAAVGMLRRRQRRAS